MDDFEMVGYDLLDYVCTRLGYDMVLINSEIISSVINNESIIIEISVNEVGKTPYRVVLETKIVKCEKEKQDGNY